MGGYFTQQHRIIRAGKRTGNVVLAKQRDGHFHATVVITGAPIDTLVDTGATLTVLTPQDATRRFNMDRLQFSGQARTANGIVATPCSITASPLAHLKNAMSAPPSTGEFG